MPGTHGGRVDLDLSVALAGAGGCPRGRRPLLLQRAGLRERRPLRPGACELADPDPFQNPIN